MKGECTLQSIRLRPLTSIGVGMHHDAQCSTRCFPCPRTSPDYRSTCRRASMLNSLRWQNGTDSPWPGSAITRFSLFSKRTGPSSCNSRLALESSPSGVQVLMSSVNVDEERVENPMSADDGQTNTRKAKREYAGHSSKRHWPGTAHPLITPCSWISVQALPTRFTGRSRYCLSDAEKGDICPWLLLAPASRLPRRRNAKIEDRLLECKAFPKRPA